MVSILKVLIDVGFAKEGCFFFIFYNEWNESFMTVILVALKILEY